MERQNNTKVLIAGLLLSAIIVAGGFYYLQTKAGEAVDPAEPTVSEGTAYENVEYGFSLELQSGWATEERVLDWGDLGTSDSVDFGVEEEGELYSLFNISVHSKDQWMALEEQDGPMPTYLGETDTYVFGYSTAQDDANGLYAEKMDQVAHILSTLTIEGKLTESGAGNPTYENTEYGYSLTYGSDWDIQDVPGTNIRASDLADASNFSIGQTDDVTGDIMKLNIQIRKDLSCTTLQGCIDVINDLEGYDEGMTQTVVEFAGEDAITEEATRTEAGYTYIKTVLFHDGDLYQITFISSTNRYDEYKPMYEEVINTFQFTE